MGIFDGIKEAFSGNDKPLVSEDRITPFDRWLGLDKELAATQATVQTVMYIDPADASNYMALELAKPMGIAFVENEGECGGVCIDEVLDSGSASSAETPLQQSDQLVAVGSTLVLGWEFDAAIEAIKSSEGLSTKLVFFRGPTAFLYGPTKPDAEWYSANLL
eukprot:CAMPEP_0119310130 /NCGR_PEP_ID=MMETSP1333-20130426/17728_1 /TAXON_ID=418940 /ORGANISM="Scyphosphaera apsteinii, Strain RCC1455" /LENGTH=161 /DNA_ID=CAMNT_0007314251 /DNA_START=133 /DNA_END=618 /DNA_ORIENTATION=+